MGNGNIPPKIGGAPFTPMVPGKLSGTAAHTHSTQYEYDDMLRQVTRWMMLLSHHPSMLGKHARGGQESTHGVDTTQYLVSGRHCTSFAGTGDCTGAVRQSIDAPPRSSSHSSDAASRCLQTARFPRRFLLPPISPSILRTLWVR